MIISGGKVIKNRLEQSGRRNIGQSFSVVYAKMDGHGGVGDAFPLSGRIHDVMRE